MISHTALNGTINPNTYIISTIIFYLRNIQAYSRVSERRLFTRMAIPSCLRAHSFNFSFQNPADSALVMENNWPTLQSWLLFLLRFLQKLVCQQPLESGGGRAQRCPPRCRLTTLSSSLSLKPDIPPKLWRCGPKASAAAVDEVLWWRPWVTAHHRNCRKDSNFLQVKSQISELF